MMFVGSKGPVRFEHGGSNAAVLSLFLLVTAAAGCYDLDVTNLNDPDLARALGSADGVESLIGGSYNTWYLATYEYFGIGTGLSAQSFQHASPWSCPSAQTVLSWIPRPRVQNDLQTWYCGEYLARPWDNSYRALVAVADGLRTLEESPELAEALGENAALRVRAFGKFVQGMAHASLAVVYDQALVIDEATDRGEEQAPRPYAEVMEAALGYFDEAIRLAGQGDITIPTDWLPTYAETTADELVRAARSQRARYRAAVARTPEERRAVDWAAVVADIDAGVTEDWDMNTEFAQGWFNWAAYYISRAGWSEAANFMAGMSDTSGNYQRWLALPLHERRPIFPDGDPFLYITPDTRFPQGTTVAEQVENPGTVYAIPTEDTFGWNIDQVWGASYRQTWRWSYYWAHDYADYGTSDGRYTEIDIDEMRLLKAEALYYEGRLGEVAELVNVTREAAGLNATDAAGTNTSCVPRLPDGTCGGLFEMLKWEKRHEARLHGLFAAPWYFDSRGWGDLFAGTQLHLPIPCPELRLMDMLPCYTFGSVGDDGAAPVSTYHWPSEG